MMVEAPKKRNSGRMTDLSKVAAQYWLVLSSRCLTTDYLCIYNKRIYSNVRCGSVGELDVKEVGKHKVWSCSKTMGYLWKTKSNPFTLHHNHF